MNSEIQEKLSEVIQLLVDQGKEYRQKYYDALDWEEDEIPSDALPADELRARVQTIKKWTTELKQFRDELKKSPILQENLPENTSAHEDDTPTCETHVAPPSEALLHETTAPTSPKAEPPSERVQPQIETSPIEEVATQFEIAVKSAIVESVAMNEAIPQQDTPVPTKVVYKTKYASDLNHAPEEILEIRIFEKQYMLKTWRAAFIQLCEVLILHKPYLFQTISESVCSPSDNKPILAGLQSDLTGDVVQLTNGIWVSIGGHKEEIQKRCLSLISSCGFSPDILYIKSKE